MHGLRVGWERPWGMWVASAALLGVLEVRQFSVGGERSHRVFLGGGCGVRQGHAGGMLPLRTWDPSAKTKVEVNKSMTLTNNLT